MKKKTVCQKCEKEYLVSPCRIGRTKYCSRLCQTSAIGVIGGATNKGKTKGLGLKRPYMTLRNKLIKRKRFGTKDWKGDNVGYSAMHMWIKRNYGTPIRCEFCSSTYKLEWANKSGKYLREDRSDWLQLCAKCHRKYDSENRNVIKRFNNHELNQYFTPVDSTIDSDFSHGSVRV